jgi:hypothetical protein
MLVVRMKDLARKGIGWKIGMGIVFRKKKKIEWAVLSEDRDQSGPSSFLGKGRIKDRYISAANQGTLLHMDQCQCECVHLSSRNLAMTPPDRARSKAVWIHVIHGVLCTQHDMRCVRWNLGPAGSRCLASRSVELSMCDRIAQATWHCSVPSVFLSFLFF